MMSDTVRRPHPSVPHRKNINFYSECLFPNVSHSLKCNNLRLNSILDNMLNGYFVNRKYKKILKLG